MSQLKGRANYGDLLYQLRAKQHSQIVQVFRDLAASPDYVELAMDAIVHCVVHKDDEVREAKVIAGEDTDLYRRQKAAAYAYYTRVTTILRAIAAGHWQALDGYGYNTMYSIAGKLVRPERRRPSEQPGMTLARFRSVKTGIQEATDYQIVEVLAIITQRLNHEGAKPWERAIAKALETQLMKRTPKSLLDRIDIPEAPEVEIDEESATYGPIPQSRDVERPSAAA